MPPPRNVHRAGVRALSVLIVAIGVALIVEALAAGHGPLAARLVIGVLFVAAGGARLFLQGRRQ